MSLSADEQDLFDEGRAVVPHWFFSRARANEELGMFAKMVGAGLAQIRDWLQVQTKITTAQGATSTTPDWLGQHARDRGTFRQSGESDAALRDRLRKFEHGLTRTYLLQAVQSMLTTYGVAGTAYMVELPRDGAFFGTVTANTGAGGVFSGPVSGTMTFTPSAKFRMPPFKRALSQFDADGETDDPTTFAPVNGRVRSYQITFTGSTSAGNNGTFATTGMVGNGVQYTNASGVAGTDVAPTWTVKRKDWQGVVLDGRKDTYLSRGFRLNRRGGEIIIILPYGTTEAQRKSILEMVRTKKGAGIGLRVERRANP
jgi:hypothetical protein